MSLLESMRSGSDSTFMQVVLALVVISFVGWGARTDAVDADVAATVDGERISNREVAERIRRMEQYAPPATTDADRARMREDAINALIKEKALLQEAKRLGLEVSDAEVADTLLEYKFLYKDGKFSQEAYQEFLERRSMTRGSFEEREREQLLLRKLGSLMALGTTVSDPVVRQTFVDQNTKVDLEVVRIPGAVFGAKITPTDEEITAWAAGNESAVKAKYEADFSKVYDQKEKVKLAVVRLAVRDDGLALADLKSRMDKIKLELDGGADFAAVARKWSEDPSAARGGEMAEIAVASLDSDAQQAVANLQVGQLSGVVVGSKDVRILKLIERTPAKVITLDEARKDITTALMREAQGPVKAFEFAEKTVLAQWKATGELPKAELDAMSLRSSQTGPIPVGGEMRRPVVPPEVLKAASRANVGDVLGEVFQKDGTYFVAKLTARTDADLAEFDNAADRYRETSLEAARAKFFEQWIDAVVARSNVKRITAAAK